MRPSERGLGTGVAQASCVEWNKVSGLHKARGLVLQCLTFCSCKGIIDSVASVQRLVRGCSFAVEGRWRVCALLGQYHLIEVTLTVRSSGLA